MDLENFITQVADSFGEPPSGPLTAKTDFKALPGWDSMTVLTVTDTIETEYGVLLRKDDYKNCDTLGDLYQLVSSKS